MAEQDWRIEVARSGGFAGLRRRASVSASDLDQAQAEELETLLARAERAGAGTRSAAPARADGFQYDVTIERGGRTEHFTVHDGAMPDEVQEMIARLQPHLKPG